MRAPMADLPAARHPALSRHSTWRRGAREEIEEIYNTAEARLR